MFVKYKKKHSWPFHYHLVWQLQVSNLTSFITQCKDNKNPSLLYAFMSVVELITSRDLVATYLVNIEQRECGNLAGILKFVLFQQENRITYFIIMKVTLWLIYKHAFRIYWFSYVVWNAWGHSLGYLPFGSWKTWQKWLVTRLTKLIMNEIKNMPRFLYLSLSPMFITKHRKSPHSTVSLSTVPGIVRF